jgi:hypothetical protein
MSDYNQRQYCQMLERLTAFEQGRLPLNTLVNDLEGLLNALQGVQPVWRQTFLHHWGKLEDERAFVLFKGLNALDAETSQRARAAVSQLKLVVLEKIDAPANHPRHIHWTRN